LGCPLCSRPRTVPDTLSARGPYCWQTRQHMSVSSVYSISQSFTIHLYDKSLVSLFGHLLGRSLGAYSYSTGLCCMQIISKSLP
jgi:hypothetical protein